MPTTIPPGGNGGVPPQQNQTMAQMGPAASTDVANAQQILKQVRREIAAFHNLRRRNNEVAAGLRMGLVPPMQARQIMAQLREPQKEQEAVAMLRQLIGILAGREPTRQEVQAGLPPGIENSLGAWPAVVVTGVAATGASVYSIFSYLRAREENIFQQTANPAERMMRRVTDNIWSITALGAVGVLGYMYWKEKAGYKDDEKDDDEDDAEDEPRPRPRPVGKLGDYIEKIKANPSEEDEDEQAEEEVEEDAEEEIEEDAEEVEETDSDEGPSEEEDE